MVLHSVPDSRELARRLLSALPAQGLLVLSGALGAGKTTLTQQLGLELGSTAHISSPTYTLIHEYPSPAGLLVHMDAYRLPTGEDLMAMGLDDYLERARLVVVEWGEDLLAHYPAAWSVKLLVDDSSGAGRVRRAELFEGKTRVSLGDTVAGAQE